MTVPLVTAVMPTAGTPQRRLLAQVAIACFRRQTHPHKRLLILNHGEPLGASGPDIREINVPRPPTLGGLRNLAFPHLTPDDYFITWDDDDWHADNRIAYQLANLLTEGKQAAALTAYVNVDVRPGHERAFVRSCRQFRCGACCGTILCRVGPERYPELERREDSDFAQLFRERKQLVACAAPPTLYIRLCHGTNTSGTQHILTQRCTRSLLPAELAQVKRALYEYVESGALAKLPKLSAHRAAPE